jgi:hypothetical protein
MVLPTIGKVIPIGVCVRVFLSWYREKKEEINLAQIQVIQ